MRKECMNRSSAVSLVRKESTRWAPGLLAWAASALPLSYDKWTTTIPHNPHVYCAGGTEVPQSHTYWQPLASVIQTLLGASVILESVPQQLWWITQGHPHALAGCKTYWWTRLGAASEAAVDNCQLRSSLGPQDSFLTLFLSLGMLSKRRKREQGAGNKAALSPFWGENIRTKAMLHNWQGVLWLAAIGSPLTNIARWRSFNGHNLGHK